MTPSIAPSPTLSQGASEEIEFEPTSMHSVSSLVEAFPSSQTMFEVLSTSTSLTDVISDVHQTLQESIGTVMTSTDTVQLVTSVHPTPTPNPLLLLTCPAFSIDNTVSAMYVLS